MIKVNKITKRFKNNKYGNILPVNNVSFNVEEGEFFGLVGRSGSGKTSLGKLILGLYTPDKGEVIINNRDVTNCLVEKRVKEMGISMVFQHPDTTLNPGMTVRKSMKEIRRSITDAEIERYLDEVNLLEKIDMLPYSLSGGEKRRVALIQALAVNPKILIADEIFSGVDSIVRNTIANLLKKIQKEVKLTLILISHDIEIVEYLCDRKVTMENGKLVEGVEKL